MSITFRVGRHIDPSGFGLAVVDLPDIDPERNISLIDYSHRWEENVASSDRSVVEGYVDSGGHTPLMTVTEFVVTNVATTATNDIIPAPLYYRHKCRFYHFSYGENPSKQIYITDQEENILKDINYLVRTERVVKNVYRIEVLTDFYNNESSMYKVKYNRCNVDGSSPYPGWAETLNASPFFTLGSPFAKSDEYALWGPDDNGLYCAIVPPVPTLSSLVNSIGISFENCPTLIQQDVTNDLSEYPAGITIKYTLKATGTTTFSVQRNYTLAGIPSTDYLQSATSSTWGPAPYNIM